MRLTDILKPTCIRVPLLASTKQEAIFEMVDLLASEVGITDVEQLKQAVWQREQTRTTGIGKGVAIPHGKCACVTKLNMAIGKLADPIDFASIDGRPVDLIILLASPADQTGPHIQALATISKLLCVDQTHAAIKAATTASELYDVLTSNQATTAD